MKRLLVYLIVLVIYSLTFNTKVYAGYIYGSYLYGIFNNGVNVDEIRMYHNIDSNNTCKSLKSKAYALYNDENIYKVCIDDFGKDKVIYDELLKHSEKLNKIHTGYGLGKVWVVNISSKYLKKYAGAKFGLENKKIIPKLPKQNQAKIELIICVMKFLILQIVHLHKIITAKI